MRVLAIDPGYDRLGIAVLEGTGSLPILIDSCCITTDVGQPFPDRLVAAGERFAAILSIHKPEIIAIETLFFSRNVKTAMKVAHMRGILLYLARGSGCEVQEFSPQAVKLAITGHGSSDKKAIRHMLLRLVPNVPANTLDDEYDAIAVGITCLAHLRQREQPPTPPGLKKN